MTYARCTTYIISFHYAEGVVSSTPNDFSKPLGNYSALMRQPLIRLKLF